MPYQAYINTTATSTTATHNEGFISIEQALNMVEAKIERNEKGIHPSLYFRYVKSKFGTIEKVRMDARLKKLERAALQAIENGQDAMAEKFMADVVLGARESALYAKGVRQYISREDLNRYKRNIRGGHISDTEFKEFTRVIPKEVLKRKKELEPFFDGFVIYHYWDENAEKVRAGKQKMTPDEKSKMRDPVLFGYLYDYQRDGICKHGDRLYFIGEWDDEHCDLTFDELAEVVGGKERLDARPKVGV